MRPLLSTSPKTSSLIIDHLLIICLQSPCKYKITIMVICFLLLNSASLPQTRTEKKNDTMFTVRTWHFCAGRGIRCFNLFKARRATTPPLHRIDVVRFYGRRRSEELIKAANSAPPFASEGPSSMQLYWKALRFWACVIIVAAVSYTYFWVSNLEDVPFPGTCL
jgi:hypothetical protein